MLFIVCSAVRRQIIAEDRYFSYMYIYIYIYGTPEFNHLEGCPHTFGNIVHVHLLSTLIGRPVRLCSYLITWQQRNALSHANTG